MMTPRDIAVVVVAAGLGTRLGANQPKAFVQLASKPILQHALVPLKNLDALLQVVIVVPAGFEPAGHQLAASALAGTNVQIDIVVGGETRQQSIDNALKVLAADSEIILVHDAARAFTPLEVFERVAAAVRTTGNGVLPVLPVSDTIKHVDGEIVLETIDRNNLRVAQTPQGFKKNTLVAAYAAATRDYTDDAALVQAHGVQITSVLGDAASYKITTADDLASAQNQFGATLRTGIGTDVHRFSDDENKKLYLGCVVWPGERGLEGHSDGDAVSHAIVDALLSAAGLGDIGSNFGVDRPEFAGANGEVFLNGTLDLLRKNGFTVQNIAVQIIGNRPKVAPMRELVEVRLSDIIGAPVTLGATTTDGLGFLGNDEGVAAVATALIQQAKGRLAS